VLRELACRAGVAGKGGVMAGGVRVLLHAMLLQRVQHPVHACLLACWDMRTQRFTNIAAWFDINIVCLLACYACCRGAYCCVLHSSPGCWRRQRFSSTSTRRPRCRPSMPLAGTVRERAGMQEAVKRLLL
jgi:hypothetical protein